MRIGLLHWRHAGQGALVPSSPRGAGRPIHRPRCRPCCQAVNESDRATVVPLGGSEAPDHQVLECFTTGSEAHCVLLDEDSGIVTDDAALKQLRTIPDASERPPLSATDLLLLVSPFFFWGTSMAAMKELAPHTTPLLLAAWRLIPAGLAVLGWAYRSGRQNPEQPIAWVAVSLFGLVDGAMFQGFLAEGLQRTSAGLGSVIIDSQPLTVALLASLLFGERLGAAGYAGLGVGVLGLCLLEVPPSLLMDLGALPEALAAGGGAAAAGAAQEWSLWDSGEWWMLLAAQSMAVGTVMVRWVARYCDPVVATGWHMVLGGLPLLALGLLEEGRGAGDMMAQLTGLDITLLLYVTLLGSAASYGVFFFNASRGNLTALSSLTFLTPMFAAASGYFFLGERLTPLQLAGAAVTLGAVYLINTNQGRAKEE